jgi:hypothetical protein
MAGCSSKQHLLGYKSAHHITTGFVPTGQQRSIMLAHTHYLLCCTTVLGCSIKAAKGEEAAAAAWKSSGLDVTKFFDEMTR